MAGGGRRDYPRDDEDDREEGSDLRFRAADDRREAAQVLGVRQGDRGEHVERLPIEARRSAAGNSPAALFCAHRVGTRLSPVCLIDMILVIRLADRWERRWKL